MKKEINDYIYGLSYDPRKLLAIPGETLKESVPFYSDEMKEQKYILCTNSPKNITSDFYDIYMLNGSEGIIYPGALIITNQELAFGRPRPVTLERAPLRMSINLPGLQDEGKIEVENPTNSNVVSRINSTLDYWFNNCKDYTIASKQQITTSQSFSQEQTALSLGFHLSWASKDIQSSFTTSSDEVKTSIVSMYKQVFYSISIDIPPTPSDFFASNVSKESLINVVDNENPLGYIRSIDYGRTFFIKIESKSADSKNKLQSALSGSLNNNKVEVDFDLETQEILKTSTISIVILGGNASKGSKIISCANLSELNNVIAKNAELRKDNTGIPISYTVAFSKDNSVATVSSSTNYVEKKYEIHEKTSFNFSHRGGYIAYFIWEYNEKKIDKDGKISLIPKRSTTGNITAPYDNSFDLPGNCCDIRIRAGEMSGLVWDYWEGSRSWREIFNKYTGTSSSISAYIWGTTLSPQHEVKY